MQPLMILRRPMTVWREIRQDAAISTSRIVGLAIASVLSGIMEAGVLGLVATIAAALVSGDQAVVFDMGPVHGAISVDIALWSAISLTILRLLTQLLVAWLPATMIADVQASLRQSLVMAFSVGSHRRQSEDRDGHLQEVVSSQVAQAAAAVSSLAGLLSSIAMFLALAGTAFLVNVPVAVLVLTSAAVLFAVLRPLNSWGRKASARLTRAHLDQAGSVAEFVRVSQDVKVFGVERAVVERVSKFLERSRIHSFHYHFSSRLAQTSYQGLILLLVVAGLAALYWGSIGDFSSLSAAVLMLIRASTYGQQAQGFYQSLMQALPNIAVIRDTIRGYRMSAPLYGDVQLSAVTSVEFENVGFEYGPDRRVLEQISFTVNFGEVVAIVGPSGSGKSTLAQILLRLQKPSRGTYRVSGNPVDDYSAASWAKSVAIVPQTAKIIHSTVRQNISFFREITEDDVQAAAKAAAVHADVAALPQQYETVIDQSSRALSGGQAQRISIARALAGAPGIIVLDEPTSALDRRAEMIIGQTLDELRGRATVFLITHRAAPIEHCDKVIVLEDGHVAAFGNPADVAQANSFLKDAMENPIGRGDD